MKILLVNNNTVHLKELTDSLAGHEVEIQNYQPGIRFHDEDKDLIILSGGGGEGLEIDDMYLAGHLWYEDQMEFVKRTSKPVIGICMGFEVIARAFGAPVKQMPSLLEGFYNFNTTAKGQKMLGLANLEQFEAHRWHVPYVPEDEFEILAESESGVEIIKHKWRKIIATQFHPEKGGTLKLPQLLMI